MSLANPRNCFNNGVVSRKMNNDDIQETGSNCSFKSSTSNSRQGLTALPRVRNLRPRRVRPVSIQFLERGVTAMERHLAPNRPRAKSLDKPLPEQPGHDTRSRDRDRKGKPGNKSSPFKMFSNRSRSIPRERSTERTQISAPFGAAKGVPPATNPFATDYQGWTQLESVEPRDPNLRHASDPTHEESGNVEKTIGNEKVNLLPRSTSMFSFTSFSSLVGHSLGNIFKGRASVHPGTAGSKKAPGDANATGAISTDVSADSRSLMGVPRDSDGTSNQYLLNPDGLNAIDDPHTAELIGKSPKLQKFFFGSSSLFNTPKRNKNQTGYESTDVNGSPSKARRSMYNLGYSSIDSLGISYEKSVSSEPNVHQYIKRPATPTPRYHADQEPAYKFSDKTKPPSGESTRPSTQDGSSGPHGPSLLRFDGSPRGTPHRQRMSEFPGRLRGKAGFNVNPEPESGDQESLISTPLPSAEVSNERMHLGLEDFIVPSFRKPSYEPLLSARLSHEDFYRERNLSKASKENLSIGKEDELQKKSRREVAVNRTLTEESNKQFGDDYPAVGMSGKPTSSHKPDSHPGSSAEGFAYNNASRERGFHGNSVPTKSRFDETISGLKQHPNVMEFAEPPDWYKRGLDRDPSPALTTNKPTYARKAVAKPNFNEKLSRSRAFPADTGSGRTTKLDMPRLDQGVSERPAGFEGPRSESRYVRQPQFDENATRPQQDSTHIEPIRPQESYEQGMVRGHLAAQIPINDHVQGQFQDDPLRRIARVNDLPQLLVSPASSNSQCIEKSDEPAPAGLTPPPRHPGRLNHPSTQLGQSMPLAMHNVLRKDEGLQQNNFSKPWVTGDRWQRFQPCGETIPTAVPHNTPNTPFSTPPQSPRPIHYRLAYSSDEGGSIFWIPGLLDDDIGRAE